jgi:Protein of unknown function (DUF402)
VSWPPGETIVFRQVWQGRAWVGIPVCVVSDEPGLLVTYLPERAPLGFADGDWPGGLHPWAHRKHWEGHGTLMLRRPADRYSIWIFWQGERREFACWYVNFEQPYRRSQIGIDTLDHELDLWSEDGATWHRKDVEGVSRCVAEGRFDEREAARIHADADAFEATTARDGAWWDLGWASWEPAEIPEVALPEGWELVPPA